MSVEAAARPGAETGVRPPAPAPRGGEPPRWLRLLAFVPAAGVLALGATGLLLAVNGWYRPALAYSLGGAVWVALVVLARPVLGPVRSAVPLGSRGALPAAVRVAHVYAAIGVAAIVAITVWNMANSSQHVLVDRDGGSYTNTGRWIAREGSLDVEPRVGPFAHDPTVGFGSLAVFDMPDGSLQFQFAHLLPVVLAEAYAVGGNFGLFHAPQILGGFALLAFFVLAWRLFRRPLFALSAMLALAFIIPEVSFSRDSYSEIPSQILLFTALWVLVSPSVLPRWRLALVSGLFLGALEATRIDGIVFLIGVPVVCLVAWLRADPADRRRVVLPSIAAISVGVVPGLLLGLVDLMHHSGIYYGHLHGNVRTLRLSTEASVLGCVVVGVAWRYAAPGLRRLPWERIATAAAGAVAVVGFGAWAFRPRLQHLRGSDGAIVGLQKVEHLTVDATRLYWERSLSWMAWYLGPLTLAVAIVGAALLVRSLLLGRMTRVFGAARGHRAGFGALPLPRQCRSRSRVDHAAIPARRLPDADPPRARPGRVGGVVAGAVAPRSGRARRRRVRRDRGRRVPDPHRRPCARDGRGDGLPGCRHRHLRCGRSARRGRRGRDRAHGRGRRLGPASSARVVRSRGRGHARGAHTADLERLATEWDAAGRHFFVVSSSLGYVQKLLPNSTFTSTRRAADRHLLAPTLTHRPDAYRSQTLQLVVASVPPV